MEYSCIDRGSERCPCILMEYGQCYTCRMSREGVCGCGPGWEGVCPYTEYCQQGGKPCRENRWLQAEVLDIKRYSAALEVVRVQAPMGAAQACRRAGSFMMVQSLGHMVPLSVLRAEPADGAGDGWLEFAVQPTGPKTRALLGKGEEGGNRWVMRGPYFSGLCGIEKLDKSRPVLVAAKGSAAAPFINIRESLLAHVLLDTDKLTEEFTADYLGGMKVEHVDFARDFERVAAESDNYEQVMFLASPFYTKKFFEMRPARKGGIITANHSNMCCGEGICGSCSFSDEYGVTVRRCKCQER